MKGGIPGHGVTYDRENDILFCDNTILSTFATCPLKATISYGLDRRRKSEDNANLVMGQAIHLALEHYFVGGSVEECRQIVEDNYKAFAAQHIYDDKRLCWTNIERVFLSWCAKYPQEKLPFSVQPENIEIAVSQPLTPEGDIILTGRMDLLAQAKYGVGWYAVDHKCTGNIDAKKKKEYSMTSQMTGYLWMLQAAGYDISGIYINAVHAGIVPGNSTRKNKCKVHNVDYSECGLLHMKHELLGPYQRSQAEIDTWYGDAVQLAKEWREVLRYVDGDIVRAGHIQQRGRFVYQACNYCPWAEYCKGGTQSYWLERETEIHTWRPGCLGDE